MGDISDIDISDFIDISDSGRRSQKKNAKKCLHFLKK